MCSDGEREAGVQPKDGRLTSLSEHGAGLLVREPHPCGARVAVSFTLPSLGEPVTTTGVVRWSDSGPRGGSWYPLGVEWVSPDDVIRHRLHQFLAASTAETGPSARPLPHRVLPVVLLVALMGMVALGMAATSLRKQRDAIAALLDARETTLRTLTRRERALQVDLAGATAHLQETSEQLGQLGRQAQVLEEQARRFQEALLQVQSSQAVLRRQRDAMMDRVVELEQERLHLLRRSVPLAELSLAIREAIARREDPELSQEPPASPITIRVHDPQPQ